ncbi:structural protein [Caudoviricetes sp.]|nr:structural protein [Caudoviricetes sp.]
MLKVSTGLRNAMMVTGSMKSQLDNGFIKIYRGTIPLDADASVNDADRLVTISLNSTATGLTINTVATNGTATKATGTWSGLNILTDTASFWRFVSSTDTGVSSTTQPRLQGNATTAGGELVMTSLSIISGGTTNIDFFSVNLPA